MSILRYILILPPIPLKKRVHFKHIFVDLLPTSLKRNQADGQFMLLVFLVHFRGL